MKRNRKSRAQRREAVGFLARLRSDARGSAAAMLAMMVIPLLLFVGSAVDVSRVYTVKARLQQACDAGVLAGRRSMTDTSTTTPLDATAATQAKAFFNNNFHNNQDATDPTNPAKQGAAGWMQTTSAPDPNNAGKYLVIFQPSKTSEAQVQGTATVKVPMTVMKMFGFQPITLTVTCEARFDTSDTDIMFVLDQTGSMSCLTSDDNDTTCKNYVAGNVVANGDGTFSVTEKSGSRISGLRTEVLNFFDQVTKLKANGGSADPATNFRFGFVPYSATANVGKLLKPLGYVQTSASYQSRVIGDANSSSAPVVTTSTTTAANCAVGVTRTPVAGTFNKDSNGNYYATVTTTTYTPGSNASNGTCRNSAQQVVPQWTYQQRQLNTAGFIAGGAVANPAQFDGSTSTWSGCVEERIDPSSKSQTSFSMTSPPKDLDPDSAPASAADGWAPWWPDVTFARMSSPEVTTDLTRTFYGRLYNGTLNGPTSDYVGKAYNEVACPLAAKRLTDITLPGNSSASAKANVRSAIQNYLLASNGFRPYGTTYHDVGMTWGLRLISPTGMFASDTAAWSGHNAPNRFIIFLTDGDIETDPYRINSGTTGYGDVYSEFGTEKYDGRVGNGATGDALDNYHNQRFLAECQLAKNRNIKIFVIAYAQALTNELTACASPNQAYTASNQAGLNAAFSQIAQQVALLRISK